MGFLSPFPPSVTLKTDVESSLKRQPRSPAPERRRARCFLPYHVTFGLKDSHALFLGLIKASCKGLAALLCQQLLEPLDSLGNWQWVLDIPPALPQWHSGSLKKRQKVILAISRRFPGFKFFCIFSNKLSVFAFLPPLFSLCSSSSQAS